jgi:hypothetical protein
MTTLETGKAMVTVCTGSKGHKILYRQNRLGRTQNDKTPDILHKSEATNCTVQYSTNCVQINVERSVLFTSDGVRKKMSSHQFCLMARQIKLLTELQKKNCQT